MALPGVSVSMTSFQAILKNWYLDRKNLYAVDAYENKLLAAIGKKTDATGFQWNVGVKAQQVVGGAGTYAQARTNANAGLDVDFIGSWKDRYHLVFIDEKVIQLSKDAEGAIAPALQTKMDSCRDNFNDATNFQLFRSESGEVGYLSVESTGSAGGTWTFTTNTGVPATQRLKVGTVVDIVASASASASPLQGGSTALTKAMLVPGSWTITNVLTNGQVIASPNSVAATNYTPANGDLVFINGDDIDGGNITTAPSVTSIPTGLKSLCGLASWCPPFGVSTSDSFKQVNRSQNAQALAGIIVQAPGLKMSEATTQAGITAKRFGAKTKMIFMHPTNYLSLVAELQGQQRYPVVAGRSGVKLSGKQAEKYSFSGLALSQGGGDIIIVDDWACHYNYSWALETDSLCLHTKNPWPYVRDLDGIKMLRNADTNGPNYVFELFGTGELLCYAPGHQAVIIHSSAV